MSTKLIFRVFRMVAVLSFVLILSTAGSSQAADITIDGTQKFQTMNGFGVNANSKSWNNGELMPALDTLIDTMGATVWRVVVESVQNWETTNDDSNPFNFNWTYYNSHYETEKFQKLWGLLGYLKQKNVDTIMVSVMGCLPSWMGGCSLNSDYEDEWVEMVTSLLSYARNTKNLRIDMFDPFNETDITNEGPSMGATQYIRVLKKLVSRMDTLGLGDIEIIGPTTADVGTGRDWMQDMLSDSQIMGKVRHFGFHSYSGNSSGIGSDIKGSASPDRNFWMTEFSAWCNGCDAGGQPPDDWTFGSTTFDYLRNHINQGAASALIWEGYDSIYEHPPGTWSYWGLMKYNASSHTYTPRKRMYINAHVFRFVRPGAVRIGASTGQSGLTLLAFRNAATDSLTIVGRNSNSSALTMNGTLTGLSPITDLKFYETTQAANFRRNADVPVSNNTFSTQVAGNSFFTLSTISALGACEVTPSVTEGTIGTEIVLTSLSPCFGDRKGKILIGDVATTISKDGWTDTSVTTIVKKVPKGSPNTFPVTVKTKSEGNAAFTLGDTFTVNLPQPDALTGANDNGAQGANINLTGDFFTIKKGKIYLGYKNSKGQDKLKSCKIVSWGMNAITFEVPELDPGIHPLSISNKVGTVQIGNFMIN